MDLFGLPFLSYPKSRWRSCGLRPPRPTLSEKDPPMYVPDAFVLSDPEEIGKIIRSHDFGLLVTAAGGSPAATHLPFLLDDSGGPQGRLLGHMARPNRQWRDFDALDGDGKGGAEATGEALVVFQGPHSYISPAWYGPEARAVPTWNYVAVHVYGRPRIIREADQILALLRRMVETQEAGFEAPWSLDSLDSGFVEALMRGIVCFEIPIDRIEAKAKLSQNKDPEMQRSLAAALSEEGGMAPDLAKLMEKAPTA
jgi:transcriptional regulator